MGHVFDHTANHWLKVKAWIPRKKKTKKKPSPFFKKPRPTPPQNQPCEPSLRVCSIILRILTRNLHQRICTDGCFSGILSVEKQPSEHTPRLGSHGGLSTRNGRGFCVESASNSRSDYACFQPPILSNGNSTV